MTDRIGKLATVPAWIQQFSDEIDALSFGPGFARIGIDTPWSFGVAAGTGVDDLKTFFHKIDDDLDTQHRLLECWQGADCVIVRGEVDMRPKDGSKPMTTDPFVWIFYMASEELERIYIVNCPTQIDKLV